jgi:hypothetical protein
MMGVAYQKGLQAWAQSGWVARARASEVAQVGITAQVIIGARL